jgi:hypothetical protein
VDVVDLLRSCRGFACCLGDRGGVVPQGPAPHDLDLHGRVRNSASDRNAPPPI